MKQELLVQATGQGENRVPWTSNSKYTARAIANATDGATMPTAGGSPLARLGDEYFFGIRRFMSCSTSCSKISIAGSKVMACLRCWGRLTLPGFLVDETSEDEN